MIQDTKGDEDYHEIEIDEDHKMGDLKRSNTSFLNIRIISPLV